MRFPWKLIEKPLSVLCVQVREDIRKIMKMVGIQVVNLAPPLYQEMALSVWRDMCSAFGQIW